MAARDAAIAEAAEAKENAQRDAAAKLRVLEAAMHRAQESEGQLLRERDELSRKLMALQREMHEQSQHAAQQAERWNQHGASASEHEARLARLKSQLDEAELGYRSARAVKATLEAELSALKQQRDEALEAGVTLRAQLAAERADHESALAIKEKDTASWKAKWKAQAAQHAEAQAQLEAAEKRVLSEAAAHAAALATRDARLRELDAQLDSGRPQEQHMFLMAREQAKRDEEVGRLRAQLKQIRDMLKESHKVLKHLMSQESHLKEELKEARRSTQRADGLNLEYLKNVVLAFLLKVYGDADNEEHIKLAHVLETLLHFSPEEKAQVRDKITYYESSWWHSTANLLKAQTAADVSERVLASAPSAAPPAAEARASGASASGTATCASPAAASAASSGVFGSLWGTLFG